MSNHTPHLIMLTSFLFPILLYLQPWTMGALDNLTNFSTIISIFTAWMHSWEDYSCAHFLVWFHATSQLQYWQSMASGGEWHSGHHHPLHVKSMWLRVQPPRQPCGKHLRHHVGFQCHQDSPYGGLSVMEGGYTADQWAHHYHSLWWCHQHTMPAFG